MTNSVLSSRHEANRSSLLESLHWLRGRLESFQAGKEKPTTPRPDSSGMLGDLGKSFNLTPFETDILALCAAVELDAEFAGLVSVLHDGRSSLPTFSLALATLPGAHWSAISPSAPLRYWHLLELGSGETLAGRSLRLSERVLHALAGVESQEEKLQALLSRVPVPEFLSPAQDALAYQIASTWAACGTRTESPIIQITGARYTGRRGIAAAACSLLKLDLVSVEGSLPAEVSQVARLFEREAVLGGLVLLVDLDERSQEATRHLVSLIENLQSPSILVGSQPAMLHRRSLRLEVAWPSHSEQTAMWRQALGKRADSLNGQVDGLAAQFRLNAQDIQNICASTGQAETAQPEDLKRSLWNAARMQTRGRLADLAQRIQSSTRFEDVVLPEPHRNVLREILLHVRQRQKVYETWGFASRSARGLGISALFAGPSGTGKTMAAEMLANELQLDLYRIDLSTVVNKYIGETEKNLSRIFDAAESGGAILLFDEADALFGRRSEIKDSHDRYANIEVSYLLQRMDAYHGLAILTTNLKNGLDPAFLRRIRFVVQFPFPDAEQRREIWQRCFPPEVPLEGLQYPRLARLNVSGGNIRNIALQAAFLAADAGEPVRMQHILSAARSEYAKLEKTLTDREVEEWVPQEAAV